jgi:SAM-dependent methyltransferase
MKKELLIGCGNSREKKVKWTGSNGPFENVMTLDVDPGCNPDVIHDLNVLPYPFETDTFDEVHGYECLEHLGQQGDWKFFFQQFSELHRILKPGGVLVATVPMWDSPWAWGDPGHTRVITKGSLLFLDQQEYQQIGTASPMTDYRPWYKADFETISIMEHEHVFGFILKAIKGNVRHSPQVAE